MQKSGDRFSDSGFVRIRAHWHVHIQQQAYLPCPGPRGIDDHIRTVQPARGAHCADAPGLGDEPGYRLVKAKFGSVLHGVAVESVDG